MSKTSVKPKNKSVEKEWPVVGHMWAFGLALLGASLSEMDFLKEGRIPFPGRRD